MQEYGVENLKRVRDEGFGCWRPLFRPMVELEENHWQKKPPDSYFFL